MHCSRKTRGPGFSLIELLVAVSIISVLMAILLPALGGARQQGKRVRELSALRSSLSAYVMYADDHDGYVLPGYRRGEARDDRGDVLGHPVSTRYPWRLAPYLDYQLKDSLLVNARQEDIEGLIASGFSRAYAVSVMPSFGLNTQFTGGNELFSWLPYVERIDEPSSPSDLIAFASARSNPTGPGGETVEGYYEVRPPMDDRYDAGAGAFRFGFVHPRYGGSAVVGFFDGHAAGLSQTELTDMRRWADVAALANDPDWTFSP